MKLLQLKHGSPEWHAYRARRVTGSTAAGILGAAPRDRSSPLSEWARLTGKVTPKKLEGEWLEWGTESEPMNRTLYQRRTGRLIDPIDAIAQHDAHDWLCYTPDGLVIACEAGAPITLPCVWEAKAPAPWTDAWSQAVPLEYQVQTQIGMEVMGCQWSSFSALIWPGVKVFDLPRSQQFIDECMAKLIRFMDYNVAKDIPPEAGAGDRDRETLAQIAAPISFDWSEEVAIKFEEVEHTQREIKERENTLDALKNQLVQKTGERGWKDAKAALSRARRQVSV